MDDDCYYDEMQEGLERGRGNNKSRAFGQRRWGSGGFVAAGGSRMAARVPQYNPQPSAGGGGQGKGKETFFARNPPKYSKKGFHASQQGAEGIGGGGGGSSSSGGGGVGDGGGGGGEVSSPMTPTGSEKGGKGKAAEKKAAKQAMKDEQKERRRSWAAAA